MMLYTIKNVDDIRLKLMRISKMSIVRISSFCDSFLELNLYINKNNCDLDLGLKEEETKLGYEYVGEVRISCETIEKLVGGPNEVIETYLRMCYDALTQRQEGEEK